MSLDQLKDIGRNINELRRSAATPIEGVVQKFSVVAVEEYSSALRESGKLSGSNLEQSITPSISVDEDGNVNMEISMNDYWRFVDEGVNGISQNQGSPYSFRPIPARPTPPGFPTFRESIATWIRKQGIRTWSYTDKDGQVIVNTIDSDKALRTASFVFMQSIKDKGIEATHFTDKAVSDQQLLQVEADLLQAISDQIFKDR